MNRDPGRFFLAHEVCDVLGIDRPQFLRLVASGELAADYWVSEKALEEYIARHLPDLAIPS